MFAKMGCGVRQVLAWAFAIVLLLTAPGPSQAVCTDYDSGPKEIGQLDLLGEARDFVIEGNRLYVCSANSFQIVDISDPQSPLPLGLVPTGDDARDVAIAGDYAYVAADDAGLLVVDISDPTDPATVGWLTPSGSANDVAILGDYAFVTTASALTLDVVDVSDPTDPTIVDSIGFPGWARGIEIVDGIAYVTVLHIGLVLIDVSNSPETEILGSVEAPGQPSQLVVRGDRVYLACGELFAVADVSDPNNPTILGQVEVFDSHDLAIEGAYAFVTDGPSGVKVIDISDPTTPQVVGAADLPGRTDGIAVTGDVGYAATGPIHLLDLSNPRSPMPIGRIGAGETTYGVAPQDGLAYVLSGFNGLYVIDLSDPTSPANLGWLGTIGGLDIAVSGAYAYVAGGNGDDLIVIDIADPTDPRIVGAAPMGWAYAVTVRGDYVFVGDHSNHLRIVDVSEPSAPWIVGEARVGTPDGGTGPHSVEVSGDYAYLIDCIGTLYVVSIADYENPVVVAELGDVGGYGVVARDGHLFTSGMSVIDVSDPADPTIVGSTEVGGGYLAVRGDHAYVPAGGHGMRVVDISDPSDPVRLGFVDTPIGAYRVATNDSHALIVDQYAGLIIAPLQCEPSAIDPIQVTEAPRLLLPSYPHPSKGETNIAFTLPEAGHVRIRITDPAGRHVRQLLNRSERPGRHVLQWDGRNETGRGAASGIYFLHLEWDGRTQTQRLILLR